MKTTKTFFLMLLISAVIMSGCGEDSNDNNNEDSGGKNANEVNWDAIPSEFSPQIEETELSTDSIQKLKTNFFGFNSHVELIYKANMEPNTAHIRLFSVFKESASFGRYGSEVKNNTYNITKYGEYACSIKISNGQITALKGGCYVKLQIILPAGSEIEVYNVGTLISKRFIAIDNATFLKSLDNASFSKEKFVVIEDYLSSYIATSKRPSLLASELGKAIGEFSFTSEKLEALKKLHMYVSDRASLEAMIEKEFTSPWDRDEALKIVR